MLDYLIKSRVTAKEPQPLQKFDTHYKKTDKESLKFIHQEATTRVKDTIADHYEISKKSFSMLLLMLSISTLLGGFLMSKSEALKINGITVIAAVALAICIFVIFVLWQMNRPIKFRAPGREPKKVMVNKIFEDIQDEETRQKYLLYQEILHCQAQIDLNQYYNTHRLSILDFIIRLVILGFLTLLTLVIITITI